MSTTPPADPLPDPASADSIQTVPVDPIMDERLSGAYRRILRLAIGMSIAAILAAIFLANWRSGLGVAIGAILACINFAWLHYGTERLVQRILSPDDGGASKLRLAFPFPARYFLLIVVAYVIVKSYPGMLIGFLVGLVLPVLASMVEGIYEALVISKIDQTSN